MKKILFVLALVAAAQVAGAQVKPEAARKAIAAAEANTVNPKKNTKAATWQKLGEAYVAAYDAPTGGVQPGWPRNLVTEKPQAEETVVVNGQPLLKLVLADKNVYVDEAGTVTFVEITNPVLEDALGKAVDAYTKAYELDPKTAKAVSAAFETISGKYINEAYNAYSFGDYAAASVGFEKAVNVSATAPLSVVDTSSIYNAGLMAQLVQDYDRAGKFFETCVSYDYYGDSGDAFAYLSEIKMSQKDTVAARTYLEEGFTKFPESQRILIGLINFYINNNENPEKLFSLLDQAKKNEPSNASLYYVEGNIRTQLGQFDEAVEAYEKCAQIQPGYEFGYYGEGVMFYNRAIDIQEQAQNELDDNKYMALVAEFEKNLKACIAPFEKAFEITGDEAVKAACAEHLKNSNYRFRDDDPVYQAGYDKYVAFLESLK